jgi:hypothetical protein
MSALPKAVKRQIDEANALVETIKKGGQPPASEPPDPNAPAVPPTAAAATVPPAQPPAAPVVTPPGTPPSDESWERKFRVLQGKYNAEVPRLSQQIRELTSKSQNLETQLVTTQALLTSLGRQQGSAPAATPSVAPASAGVKLVKDEEVTTFGPDLYDFIKRAAREVMPAAPAQPAPQMTQQVQQVQQQVQQLGARVAQNDQQKMIALLTEQVPEWEQVNEDAEFLQWLTQVDPFSGVIRQQLFDQAAERYDGPRIVAFFKGFQNEHAAVTPQPQPTPPVQPASTPQPAPAGTPAALERLVAPGTAKSGAAGAPNEAQKRIYTRTDIDQFVAKKNSFVIKGKKVPDSMVVEERAILEAGREGRISG